MKRNIIQLLVMLAIACITNKMIAQTRLSLNKPATASSTESSSYPVSNALDGSAATRWSSSDSGYNQWLYVDLGAEYDISKVSITWADGRYALVFDLLFSSDAASWTTVRTYPSNSNSGTVKVEGLYGKARYVKFNGRGRAVSTRYRIADFSVYGYSATSTTQQAELNIVTNRLLEMNAKRGVTISTVTSYNNSLAADGSWADLSYTTGGNWPAHAARLEQMALAYHKPGNTYYQSTAIRDNIVKGLSYLQRVHPAATNWFDTAIAVPEDYMVALLIMKNNISKDSLMLYANYLLDDTGNSAQRGMNRASVSGITVYKGCIEDRFPIVVTGYSSMASCLDVVTATGVGVENEGVRSDNSFHQHRGQLFTGGYGKSMLELVAHYLRYSDSLSFHSYFTNLRLQTLASCFLNGLQLLSYKDYVDFGSAGRYLSRSGAMTISPVMLDTMMKNDTANAANYQNWKNHIIGTSSFPTAYAGTKYFWKSAILTSHGPGFYLSAKVISSRTVGTESLNGENIKGYNLPLGATNIMHTGNEYRSIYPIWQWSRIPGTTAEMNETATALSSYQTGSNSFGGGLSHVDDGLMAYEHNYNGVQAKKCYVFMNNQLICLGAGIAASKSNEIITSVDQAFTNGDVSYNDGAGTYTFSGDSLTSNTFKWVHHNNIGYLFPAGGLMTLLKKNQSGSWRDISTSGSATLITGNVFSHYFRHSTNPSNRHYVYMIAPDVSLASMPSLYNNHHYSFPRNETDIQAVRYDGENNKYAVVFYSPGTIDMGDGITITSSNKALVFIKEYSTTYRISVADPLYTQTSITLILNKQLTGAGASYSNGETTVVFSLPAGDYAGSTVSAFFTKVATEDRMAVAVENERLDKTDPANELTTEKNDFYLYPNPVSAILHIKGVSESNFYEIIDMSGKILRKGKGSSANTAGLLPGAYLLTVLVNGQRNTRLFVKQ